MPPISLDGPFWCPSSVDEHRIQLLKPCGYRGKVARSVAKFDLLSQGGYAAGAEVRNRSASCGITFEHSFNI